MITQLLPASHGSQAMTNGSGLLSGHSYYLHWGVIQISLTNFLIIVFMVVVFAVALVLPFPAPRRDEQDEESSDV
jgi:hypothetical protein